MTTEEKTITLGKIIATVNHFEAEGYVPLVLVLVKPNPGNEGVSIDHAITAPCHYITNLLEHDHAAAICRDIMGQLAQTDETTTDESFVARNPLMPSDN